MVDVYQLCPGRTLSSDNAYLVLIPFAAASEGVLNALLTLSASYRKEYCPDQYQAIQQREIDYKFRTLRWLNDHLQSDSHTLPCLLVIMLLVHYCMVNEDGDHCWCVHFTALNELILRSSTTSYPSLFTAFQAVLAKTACSLKDNRLPLSDHYHWLGTGTGEELTRIDGTVGVSRAVLYIINSITVSSANVGPVPSRLCWAFG